MARVSKEFMNAARASAPWAELLRRRGLREDQCLFFGLFLHHPLGEQKVQRMEAAGCEVPQIVKEMLLERDGILASGALPKDVVFELPKQPRMIAPYGPFNPRRGS